MRNFHDRFEDMIEYELQGELYQILWKDNVQQFLALLNYLYRRGGNDVPFERALGKVLTSACRAGAVKCVAALINGDSPLVVDIHSPCYKSFYPLHYAAESGHPGVTELLLYHGARTDVRCICSDIFHDDPIKASKLAYDNKMKDHPCNLPLHIAIHKIRYSTNIRSCNWKHGCFAELLICLSLPFMQNLLETVGLLASKTDGTKEEFLHYARNGNVVQCAILLLVARKKLFDSAAAVEELVGCLIQSIGLVYEDKKVMIDLLHLFHKAGDKIEAYIKKDKLEARLQMIPEVTCLLHQAGFRGTSQDSVIRNFKWPMYSAIYVDDELRLYTQKVADIGMPHYSTSSTRWDQSKKPEPGRYTFKVPADKKLRNSWIPFWLPSSHYLKVSAYSFHTGVENGSDAKLKRFGFNSSNILSSKPWALFAGVIKRIAGR